MTILMKTAFAVILGLLASDLLRAQEICGLQNAHYELPDALFRNGFENVTALETEAQPSNKTTHARGSGLGPPLTTVSPPVLGVTPTVSITSPAAGSTITGELQLEGTFTGPTNTGISIDGQPASTYQGQFLTQPLRLDPGQHTVQVTATTLDGLTSTASRIFTIAATPPQDVRVTAAPFAGFLPYKPVFSISVRGITPQTVAVDFDGNGTDDFTGAPDDIPVTTFTTSGIYNTRITVTATDGQMYVRQRKVIAINLPEVRARACVTYAHFRARLLASDTPGALQALNKPFVFEYQQVLDALGSNRPTFAARLGTIATGIFSPTNAELVLVTEDGSELIGTPIHLSQSGDGVWKIDGL